jgi:hypothetical protein
MAIQGAEAISEEIFEEKAPYLIPTEVSWAVTLGTSVTSIGDTVHRRFVALNPQLMTTDRK